MLEDEILNEIEKNDENPNEIIEIESDNGNTTRYDLDAIEEKLEKKKKEKKVKGPSKWSLLDKKKKIIIIISGVVLLLVIVGILLYFLVFKKDKEDNNLPKEPMVIVEKDNYRYEDGKLIFKNKNGKDLGSYDCEHKDEDLCYVAYYSDEDDFDQEKYVYENGLTVENRSDILLDNYVFVYDNTGKENGNIKLYKISEEKVIGEYELVKEISEDTVIVKDLEDKYGVLKLEKDDTKKIVDFSYDYLGYILNTENIIAMNKLNYYLLDMEGKEVTKSIPGEIKSFSDKYISAIVDKEYFIYDYNGIKAKEDKYDYIKFVDSYIVTAVGKRLYAFNNNLNALNIEAIRIDSNSYNTKVIFDEDKKEKEREVAFEVKVNKDNISIEYGEEIKVINIYEGKLSSNMDYINYYDGILYVYSDPGKGNLIGSYTCENPNVITSSTTEFTNCFIAKESVLLNRDTDSSKVGYLPIYNKRYIFISDTETVKNKDNIILWDLKGKSKKATYTEVDAGYYKNEKTVNFVDTANTLVMAKNTSDSYGIIRIESSNLTGIISFKDNNEVLKYLKGNILTKRSDGSYHLYDVEGNEITKTEIKNEIIDYNSTNLLVKNSDKYLVYGLDGKIVSTDTELKYGVLYDKFFIGIDTENVLSVYGYDGKVYSNREETKVLYTSDYSKSYLIDYSGINIKLQFFTTDGKTIAYSSFVTL